MRVQGLIRIFVDDDAAAAQRAATEVATRLGTRLPTCVDPCTAEQGWHEITLRTPQSSEDPEALIDRVSANLGSGWQFQGDGLTRFAVWNRADNAAFVVSNARFAEVQVLAAADF